MSYLQQPLLHAKGELRAAANEEGRDVALAFVQAGIAPEIVEILSELVARTFSQHAGDEPVAAQAFGDLLPLPPELYRFLDEALASRHSRAEKLALAVHLLDIAENMGLLLYIPELPNLMAKADRSGDAARHVGVARHLKG